MIWCCDSNKQPSINILTHKPLFTKLLQVSYNHGGMYLFAYTGALNTALKGNMTNNVFAFGKNGEALNISGHYFQHLMLFQNYIYNYTTGK